MFVGCAAWCLLRVTGLSSFIEPLLLYRHRYPVLISLGLLLPLIGLLDQDALSDDIN